MHPAGVGTRAEFPAERTAVNDFIQPISDYVEAHGPELFARLVAAVGIMVAAVVLARMARSGIRAALARRTNDRRAATLAPAVQSLTRTSILGVGLVTALHQLGVNVTTVLAGAGVLGLAVGFGAQALVRDVISGFFLIVDGVIEAGDHVTFNQVSGIVEEVGLRMTRIRSHDGRLWYMANGELKGVGNFNREWARAVVIVPLPHEQDLDEAMRIVKDVGEAWAAEAESIVLEPPEVQGVLAVTGASVDIRLVVKVRAMEHWASERELSRRIRLAFTQAGLDAPLPRQVLYHRQNSAE